MQEGRAAALSVGCLHGQQSTLRQGLFSPLAWLLILGLQGAFSGFSSTFGGRLQGEEAGLYANFGNAVFWPVLLEISPD